VDGKRIWAKLSEGVIREIHRLNRETAHHRQKDSERKTQDRESTRLFLGTSPKKNETKWVVKRKVVNVDGTRLKIASDRRDEVRGRVRWAHIIHRRGRQLIDRAAPGGISEARRKKYSKLPQQIQKRKAMEQTKYM